MQVTVIVAAFLFIAAVTAQGPGNGVSKTTHTSSKPLVGLEFMLKYLPTSVAEDSCSSNYCKKGSFPDGEKYQGRAQLVTPFSGMVKRNCQLYSAYGGYTQDSTATNLVAATTAGDQCGTYAGYSFNAADATSLHATFAHTADQCCKACATTTGCTAATYTTEPASGARRLLQGPQPYEGYGLHLVDVMASATTGGIDVADLEGHFTTRLGDMSSFDAFLDYSTQLFTVNLPYYYSTFKTDNVPMLVASWSTDGDASTWYSIFVRVPESQLILELIGSENPVAGVTDVTPTPVETRLSARQITLYSTYVKDENNLVYAAAVSRATSNITAVDSFYTNALKTTAVLTVDLEQYGVHRRCYAWSGAKSDVCFTQRPTGAKGKFDVKDFENMLWSVHSTVLTTPAANPGDKYNDNHYAVDLQISGDYIAEYFTANNPYPLTKDSPYGFACMQSYIIDPTGGSIQTDLFFSKSYPGCGWSQSDRKLLHAGLE